MSIATIASVPERTPARAIYHFAFAALLVGGLDVIGVIGFPASYFGVSSLYIAAPVITAVCIWFGAPAFAGVYIGLALAGIYTGRWSPLLPVLTLCNVVGAAIPWIATVRLKIYDSSLSNLRDVLMHIVFAGVGQSIVSAIWFFGVLVLIAGEPTSMFSAPFFSWIIGGFLVQVGLGIVIMRGRRLICKLFLL